MYNEDEWARDTRGRCYSFFACDEEIIEVMKTALPEQYMPYSLIGTYLEKEPKGKKYVDKYFLGEIDDLPTLRSRTWQFFVRSTVLTPDLTSCDQTRITACLSLSGLVGLQHVRIRRGKRQETDITQVNRVYNIQSNAMVEHAEYARVFNAFKRALQKRLVFGTRKGMPDGTMKESTTLRMTELFAERCKSGEIVAAVDVGVWL